MDEHDIINGLQAMFIEKNKREATEEECQLWLDEIRSAKSEEAIPPLPTSCAGSSSALCAAEAEHDTNKENIQPKVDKRTYSA